MLPLRLFWMRLRLNVPIKKRQFAEKFAAFFTQIRYRDEVIEWLVDECGYARASTPHKIAKMVIDKKLRRVGPGEYQCR
jgi:hypothetical protein